MYALYPLFSWVNLLHTAEKNRLDFTTVYKKTMEIISLNSGYKKPASTVTDPDIMEPSDVHLLDLFAQADPSRNAQLINQSVDNKNSSALALGS
jgi:hypothetical protein